MAGTNNAVRAERGRSPRLSGGEDASLRSVEGFDFAQPERGGGSAQDIRFAGYAAIFDRVDRGGDVVRRGAFGAVAGRRVPLLWQHAPDRPVGLIEHMAEDERGLHVVGRVSARTAAGRRIAALVKDGAIDGLSFGYRVREAKGERPRELTALDLVEVSLVAQPMQPLARVVGVE
ncbi:HK97 family phage prohead protease [Sphingobium phenoxybenzoativorans]|uniref:HK97 family phage prohead protease n=1 Tax=Sphingobium phenoxybenzoativorans TaxID=1592790 RepID=A0A975K7P6_9SPHN|nr:HK97 family phage prohead protease [Sphingobium phenoxybenzoativorans]